MKAKLMLVAVALFSLALVVGAVTPPGGVFDKAGKLLVDGFLWVDAEAEFDDDVDFDGEVDFSEGVAYTAIDTVASNDTLTLTSSVHHVVTGTADIDSIDTASPVRSGQVIYLEFSGTAATNGLVDGKNLLLSGDFGYSPNDVVALMRRGDNFYQISESAN
jgi:hypothetical protein